MKKIVILIVGILLFMSVNSDVQRKYIRSGDYDIVCHVSIKSITNFAKGKDYYWFKSGEVHHSVSQAGGMVLHDQYQKFYRSKQLAESGYFDYGLKHGEWRTWYENGNVESIYKYKNGLKNGFFLYYDSNGSLIQSGNYSNNKKSKTWINHKLKDTTYFKGDSTYAVKPKSKLDNFIDRIFKKRDSTEKVQRKRERQIKRVNDSINKLQRKKEKALTSKTKGKTTTN